ncbi:hypothetical protein N7488_004720 [Penicillium malachiteum]|nr:hypothetical protein N7488_004720 [Penicillium malachiteum]
MSNREYYSSGFPENAAQANTTKYWKPSSKTSSQYFDEFQEAGPNQEALADQQSRSANVDQSADMNGAAEGERGLGATIVGRAGGAFFGYHAGKKSDHGILGALGGAVAGAVLANMASSAVKEHHSGHSSARDRRRERLEKKIHRLG